MDKLTQAIADCALRAASHLAHSGVAVNPGRTGWQPVNSIGRHSRGSQYGHLFYHKRGKNASRKTVFEEDNDE